MGSGFGARVHVPALRAAGFEIAALVGREAARTERRAQRLSIPRALTSLDEALAIPGVDAVTVATPPAAHAPVVLAALAAGKHVICEKPFALDVAEAHAMLAAARTAGVVHRVGFVFRWAADRVLVARAIARGAIGRPRFASLVSYVELVANTEQRVFPAWWWEASQGGGWLAASGSHAIDQIRVWLGEIESVSADLTSLARRGDVSEDSFSLLFRTASGASGVLQQTGGAWGPPAGITRIAGTMGTLWTEGDAVWQANAEGARELAMPSDLRPPDVAEVTDDSRHRYTHLELGPYTRLCESFRDAILAREEPVAGIDGTVPAARFEDGLASVEVTEAAQRSLASGQWVDVEAAATPPAPSPIERQSR
ncbi:MAG: Gfo/Idh/MocA family oxidoreductase [Myxococcota bacterium]|nr:Gfo/Idh/MocA family oxidoreductase [Myxococcota bacterium]